MASYDEVITALRAADKAGNTKDAQRLAKIAQKLKPEPPKETGQGAMPFVNREIAEGVGYVPDKLLKATAPTRAKIEDTKKKLPDFLQRGLEQPLSWGPNPMTTITQVLEGFSSKNLKKTMADYGIKLATEGEEPQTAAEYIGRTVGEASTFLLPFGYGAKTLGTLSGASRTLGVPKKTLTGALESTKPDKLVGKIAADAWKQIIRHPWMSMLTELTAAGGAGGSRYLAEEAVPEDKRDTFWGAAAGGTGELVGGIAGGVAPSVVWKILPARMVLEHGGRFLRKMSLPFSKEGAKYRAGKVVKAQVSDPAETLRRMDEETVTDLPPAVKSGEKRLVSLYKDLLNKDPVADAEAVENISNSILNLEQSMRKLGYGSPELVREMTNRRVASLEMKMEERVLQAVDSAQKLLNKVPQAKRRSVESRIVYNELKGAMEKERQSVRNAWTKVNKSLPVTVNSTRDKYVSLVDDLAKAQMEDIPSVLKKSKLVKKPKGFSAQAQEAANDVPPWTEGADKVYIVDAFNAAKAKGYPGSLDDFKGELIKAHRAGNVTLTGADLVEAMDPQKVRDSLATYMRGEFHFIKKQAPKQEATETTLKEMQGLRSKLLEVSRRAKSEKQWNKARIADEMADAVLDDINVSAQAADDESLRYALAATRKFKERFETGTVGKVLGYDRSGAPKIDPEVMLDISVGRSGAKGDVKAAIDVEDIVVTPEAVAATERYLGKSFTEYTTSKGTQPFDPVKARQWMETNAETLDKFPKMREQLSDAATAQEFANNVAKTMAVRKKAIQNPNISATARALNAPVNQEIDTIMRSKNPVLDMDQAVRRAQKDPSGDAVQGLRAGFIDYILEKSAKGPYNEIGEQAPSGRLVNKFLNRNEGVFKRLFSEKEIGRIRQVANELVKLENFGGAKPTDAREAMAQGDFVSSVLKIVGRISGAQAGRVIAGKTGGGTVQTPGILSNRVKMFMERLTQDRAFQMFNDALLSKDDSLLRALLMPIDKPGVAKGIGGPNLRMVNNRLNTWLGGAGSRVMEDIEREIAEEQ